MSTRTHGAVRLHHDEGEHTHVLGMSHTANSPVDVLTTVKVTRQAGELDKIVLQVFYADHPAQRIVLTASQWKSLHALVGR